MEFILFFYDCRSSIMNYVITFTNSILLQLFKSVTNLLIFLYFLSNFHNTLTNTIFFI